MKDPNDYYHLYRNPEFKDGKIVLRSLSDMTEEEKQEYREAAKLSVKGKNILPNIKSSTLTNEYFNAANAEIVRWLLFKHFDLFNLIPEGLATDKTTLTK